MIHITDRPGGQDAFLIAVLAEDRPDDLDALSRGPRWRRRLGAGTNAGDRSHPDLLVSTGCPNVAAKQEGEGQTGPEGLPQKPRRG